MYQALCDEDEEFQGFHVDLGYVSAISGNVRLHGFVCFLSAGLVVLHLSPPELRLMTKTTSWLLPD